MSLKFSPFKAVQAIKDASNDSPPLKLGMQNNGVKMLQSALLDLGYKMPITIKENGGVPDGIYGDETKEVVEQFQTDNKLKVDGVAGKSTILKLDELLFSKKQQATPKPSPSPTPPPFKPAPEDDNYMLGTQNPAISYDPGAGVFNSRPWTWSMWALKQMILEIVPPRGVIAAIFIGSDAARHMQHYLSAKGTPLQVRVGNMVNEVPSAKEWFTVEVNQAKKFIETLPEGKHFVTSKNRQGGYNYKHENKNWFFAVGGYTRWGKGVVHISKSAKGKLQYKLNFQYHFYDRYNWDAGKAVTIAGIVITDEFMGDFHLQGLAQEYDEVGMLDCEFSWEQGGKIPDAQFHAVGGR